METNTTEIYQVKVMLRNTGWQECHLHEFAIGGELFGPPDPDGWDMGGSPAQSERRAGLSRVLGWVGAKAAYTYDVGDSIRAVRVRSAPVPRSVP